MSSSFTLKKVDPTLRKLVIVDNVLSDAKHEANPLYVAHHATPNKHFLQRLAIYLESYRKQRQMARMLPERDAEFLDEVQVHTLMVIQILKKLLMSHGQILPVEYGYDDMMDSIMLKMTKYVDTNDAPLVSLVELNEVNIILQDMISIYYRPPVIQRPFWEVIRSLFS